MKSTIGAPDHMNTSSALFQLIRFLLSAYLALLGAATILAVMRLAESPAMPGLAAVELIMLGLPWSLALGVAPISHTGWPGMTAVVFASIALNGLLLWKIMGIFKMRRFGVRSNGVIRGRSV